MTRNLPAPLSRYRAGQISVTSGLGSHFVSPHKRPHRFNTQKKGTVAFIDLDARRQRLRKELDALLAPKDTSSSALSSSDDPAASMDIDPDDQWVDEEPLPAIITQPPDDPRPITTPNKTRRIAPDQAAIDLYAKWQALIPSLIEPLLAYTSDSIGKAARAVAADFEGSCKGSISSCERKEAVLQCLYFDRTYL
jgi:hypothetical protein